MHVIYQGLTGMQKNKEFESFLASKNYPVFDHKTRTICALIEHIKPTHFITLSLSQGRQIEGVHGGRTWVSGDDVIYEQTHKGFVRTLSKLLVKSHQWKRHKNIVRSVGVMEGGNRVERNHLHMIIAKPCAVDEETFRVMARRAAAGNPWIMNGAYGVDIQRVENVGAIHRATFYSVKHGLDRIYLS